MYSNGTIGVIDEEHTTSGCSMLFEPYTFAVCCRGGRSMIRLPSISVRPTLALTLVSAEMHGQILYALLHVWRHVDVAADPYDAIVGGVARHSTAFANHHRARHLFRLHEDVARAGHFSAVFDTAHFFFELPEPGLYSGVFFAMQPRDAADVKPAFKDVIDAAREPVVSDLFYLAVGDLAPRVCFRNYR